MILRKIIHQGSGNFITVSFKIHKSGLSVFLLLLLFQTEERVRFSSANVDEKPRNLMNSRYFVFVLSLFKLSKCNRSKILNHQYLSESCRNS